MKLGLFRLLVVDDDDDASEVLSGVALVKWREVRQKRRGYG